MLIHLVYEEDYVEQLKGILEGAGHSVVEWDYALSQFADFSERRKSSADLAIMDGQAGVYAKKEIVESLSAVRKNLPDLRIIVIFPLSLEKDEAFIGKLLTLSIYDMYFRDEYDLDDLERWITTPKTYADYNIETKDIRGVLTEAGKPRIQNIGAIPHQSQTTQSKSSAPVQQRCFQLELPHVAVKLPKLSSVIPKFQSVKNNSSQSVSELLWEEDSETLAADYAQQLLGKVIWFWGSVPGLGVTHAAIQFANILAESLPVILIDGNLVSPSLGTKFNFNGPGWEWSWLEKTPGKPPKKFYRDRNLSVWSLQGPLKVEQTEEKWSVALFHIRTPKQIVIIDGGTAPPPEGVNLNVLMVDQSLTSELDPTTVCINRLGIDGTIRYDEAFYEKVDMILKKTHICSPEGD